MRGVPETMRAAAIDRFGGPEVLTVRTVPVPEPDSGEVLIAVHTAGVGSWDAEMRAGWWPEGRPRFPVILGSDGSGQIAAVGSRVRRLKRGDRVYAYSFAAPKGGFYAGYVAVAAEKAARIPKRLGPKEAGAIPTTGLTALQGIEHLKLKVGSQTFVRDAIESGSSAVIPFRVDQDSEFDLTWGWRGQVKEEHWSGGMVPRGPMVQRHIFTIDDEGGVIYRTENKLGG